MFMNVNSDYIFSEYHNRRKKEHIPMQFFLNEMHIETTKKKFANGYALWLKRHNEITISVTEEEYISWLSGYYGKPPILCLQVWNEKKEEIKKTGRSPLANAVTAFWQAYHDEITKTKLSELTGISIVTILNHSAASYHMGRGVL